jgi:A/G-specific adenine glycosylase
VSLPVLSSSSSPARNTSITQALSTWFTNNARNLPWRTDFQERSTPRDPWHALMAEAMLQQTQVSRVLEYYPRFIARFPMPAHMASASVDDVLALWSGLGYYRRARLLHACAVAIVERHAGHVPREVDALRALPGLGQYTAGAIASIVFNIPAPIVDGNVQRVLQRLDAQAGTSDDKSLRDWAWSRADQLTQCSVSSGSPALFNEGLMELGATVCLPPPAKPRCEVCPLNQHCLARAQGLQTTIPAPKARAAQSDISCITLAIFDARQRVLIEQRPATGMWASMWQLPTVELPGKLTPEARRQHASALAQLRSASPALTPTGHFTHVTTHRRVHFAVFAAQAVNCRRKHAAMRWCTVEDFAKLGVSNAQRRALALALKSLHADHA